MDALGTISRLGGGHLLEELAEALQRTAEDVVETGQTGSVTLKLLVKAAQGIGNPMVSVEESLARSAPKRKPRGAFLYALGGELHARDPRQTEMVFQVVDATTGEIRDAGDAGNVTREA